MAKVIQVAGQSVSTADELAATLKRYKKHGLDSVTVVAEGAALPMPIDLTRAESWLDETAQKVFNHFGR